MMHGFADDMSAPAESLREEQLFAELQQKLETLRSSLRSLGAAAVCYSGGVDSTLLLAVAHEVLGERVFAVTEHNDLYPQRETDEAVAFCRDRGIVQVVLTHDPIAVEGFAVNPRNRCYLCKRELFRNIQTAADDKARELGILGEGSDGASVDEHIALLEGSNVTDRGDYRPGAQAVAEHGALSPLDAAGLTKDDIRAISNAMGLPTWNKPSFACLASRFVYGETITNGLLHRVDAAEQLLLDAGFQQVRVRMHDKGATARVEVTPDRLADAFTFLQNGGAASLHQLGFTHVSLDLDGYRTGSMNE